MKIGISKDLQKLVSGSSFAPDLQCYPNLQKIDIGKGQRLMGLITSRTMRNGRMQLLYSHIRIHRDTNTKPKAYRPIKQKTGMDPTTPKSSVEVTQDLHMHPSMYMNHEQN